MQALRLYTDLDSLFDTRRGMLTKIAREENPNFTWDNFEEVYKSRRMDHYNRPSLGITPEKYEEYYSKRSIDDWADDKECFFFPSNLLGEMLQIVRGIEFGSSQTIHISRFDLAINIFPFVLSDALADELKSHIENSFKLPIEIRLVDVPYDKQTAPYLNGYDYVFRYGHLVRPEFKTWAETLLGVVRPGTKYIVPELLAKEFEDSPDTDLLKNTSIADHIRKSSATLGGIVIFIPTDKALYDYQVAT